MRDDSKAIEAVLVVATLLFVLFLQIAYWTDDEATVRTAEAAGLESVKPNGHAWWACGKDDLSATSFTAKHANGKQVSGAVCCGLLKNCTIRW